MIFPKGVRIATVVPKTADSPGRQSAGTQSRSLLLVTSYNTVTGKYLLGLLVLPLASKDEGEVVHAAKCVRMLSA